MRHVDVECFYQVNERAPHLYERPVIKRVEGDALRFGGTLYRAPSLEKQRHTSTQTGPHHYRLDAHWEPDSTEPVHLFQTTVYGTRCCKSCRGDFISLFVRWSKGEFAQKPEGSDPERNIPVRVNGAVQMLTRAEWDAMHPDREPMTWRPE